ncbi:hypothetical protein [Chromobacterium piscinae]|uniref:Uncharacterized protein n=1 Tax=Chromobacterium piscinae TaxID=686831 RepID=A0ABV0H2W7_9NEIS|nr:hypothetical protein [Chromobacterium piscinae]MBX9296566.1 hypothetical protein [Chromobacterium vaccinii]MBX9347596.1 hypothetical protein [Chromobacterium vaccinii]MBX9356143.1 hypothetical protein [Chromobacterium vaccinii]MCD4504149.1 hypothetical protein [Chromobacterium piscinae]MCD5327557.1 hypothetical protein [Chromobacterium piscinae]
MNPSRLVKKIADDDYALDVIQGDHVLVTSPVIVGEQGSEWEGSLVFTKEYLLSLMQLGLKHRLLNPDDIHTPSL